jgi:hypothetical protein
LSKISPFVGELGLVIGDQISLHNIWDSFKCYSLVVVIARLAKDNAVALFLFTNFDLPYESC